MLSVEVSFGGKKRKNDSKYSNEFFSAHLFRVSTSPVATSHDQAQRLSIIGDMRDLEVFFVVNWTIYARERGKKRGGTTEKKTDIGKTTCIRIRRGAGRKWWGGGEYETFVEEVERERREVG